MLNLKLKVRPDPFTGRTFNYMTPAATDLQHIHGSRNIFWNWERYGRDIYVCREGERGGGLHVFLVIFTLKEKEIPPAPSRSVHVPLMHMLALPGYRRDLQY